MAYVKVGQVKSTLAKAVKYITNPDKTRGYELVTTTTGAAKDDSKGIADRFTANLGRSPGGRRKGAVLAHHIIQSFDPEDDITPEQAHSLGVRLVEEIGGGQYDYVIATHTDRHHIHNHILLCPNSNLTHRNIRIQRGTLKQWRGISDTLCRENGLHVIDRPDPERTRRSLPELHAGVRGASTKTTLRKAIDEAREASDSWPGFVGELKARGVSCTPRGRHLTYTSGSLKARDTSLGAAYTEGAVMAGLARSRSLPISFDGSLIDSRDARGLTVTLPASGRRLHLRIDAGRIIQDGRTWRAWLPETTEQTLTDGKGGYVRTVAPEDLYHWFARPETHLEDYAHSRLDATDAKGMAPRAIAQAKAIDRIMGRLDEIRALDHAAAMGQSRADRIDMLADKANTHARDIQRIIADIAQAHRIGVATRVLEARLANEEQHASDDAREAMALHRLITRRRSRVRERDSKAVRPTQHNTARRSMQ